MNALNVPSGILHELLGGTQTVQFCILGFLETLYQGAVNSIRGILCYFEMFPCINNTEQGTEQIAPEHKFKFKENSREDFQSTEASSELYQNGYKGVAALTTLCRKNWCAVEDYIHYWQERIFKWWCFITNCGTETGTEVDVVDTALTSTDNRQLFIVWFDKVTKNRGMLLATVAFTVAGIALLGYVWKLRRGLYNKQNLTDNPTELLQLVEGIRQEQAKLKREYTEKTNILHEIITKQNANIAELQEKLHLLGLEHCTPKLAINRKNELQSKINELSTRQNDFNKHSYLLQRFKDQLDEQQNQIRELGDKFSQHQEMAKSQKDAYVVQATMNIECINAKTLELETRIDDFTGSKQDTDYLNIHELLIQNTISLDNIDSQDDPIIKNKRREAIRYVNVCYSLLEDKVRLK